MLLFLRNLVLLCLLAKSTHYAYAQLQLPFLGSLTSASSGQSLLQVFNVINDSLLPSTGAASTGAASTGAASTGAASTGAASTLPDGKQQTTLTGANGGLELPGLMHACSCKGLKCSCCLGVSVARIFNNTLCLILEFGTENLTVNIRLTNNDLNISEVSFSARNPPSACIRLPLPLPFIGCLRVSELRIVGLSVRICMALNLKVIGGSQLIDYKFQCVSLGIDGIAFPQPSLANDKLDSTMIGR